MTSTLKRLTSRIDDMPAGRASDTQSTQARTTSTRHGLYGSATHFGPLALTAPAAVIDKQLIVFRDGKWSEPATTWAAELEQAIARGLTQSDLEAILAELRQGRSQHRQLTDGLIHECSVLLDGSVWDHNGKPLDAELWKEARDV